MNKKFLKYSLRLLLTLIALYIIYTKVDLTEAWYYLSRAKWYYFLAAFLSFMLSKLVSAYRINTLYRTQQLYISEVLNIKLTFLGMFYNLFIPLVGGEGYKAFWLRKYYPVKLKKLVSAALLDRASGITALTLLSVVFFMFSSFEIAYKSYTLLLIPLVYALHFLALRLFFRSFLPAWLSSNLYSLLVQILQVITTWFIILAIGIDQQLIDYLFTFLLSCYAFILPMIAAREMAFVFGADYLGLDPDLSLAISILFYLALALNSLLGAYYIFFPSRLKGDQGKRKSTI